MIYVDDVRVAITLVTEVPWELITDKTRVAPVVRARRMAALLMRRKTDWTLAKISESLGLGLSNAKYAVMMGEHQLITEPDFKKEFIEACKIVTKKAYHQ